MAHNQDSAHNGRTGPLLLFWCVVAVIGFYVITEHTAHFFGILPYLALLSCPLMHLVMHRHHGTSDDESTTNTSRHQ